MSDTKKLSFNDLAAFAWHDPAKTKKLNEDIAESMFIIDEQTKKLPPEEQAPLGSFWGGYSRLDGTFYNAPYAPERYSYRIVNLERDYEAEDTLCKYGAEGFRIVYTMGAHLLILEREE